MDKSAAKTEEDVSGRRNSVWRADLRLAARIFRRCGLERGVMFLEFALVFPILLIFTLFLYELALYWEGTVLSNHAAFAVSRIGKVHYEHGSQGLGVIDWPEANDCILAAIDMEGINRLVNDSPDDALPRLVTAFYMAPATRFSLADEPEIDRSLGVDSMSALNQKVSDAMQGALSDAMNNLGSGSADFITSQIDAMIGDLSPNLAGGDVLWGLISEPVLNAVNQYMITPMTQAAVNQVMPTVQEHFGAFWESHLDLAENETIAMFGRMAGRLNQSAIRMNSDAVRVQWRPMPLLAANSGPVYLHYPFLADGSPQGSSAVVAVEIGYPVKSDWFSLLALISDDEDAKVGQVSVDGRYAMLAELQKPHHTIVNEEGVEFPLWVNPERVFLDENLREEIEDEIEEIIENIDEKIAEEEEKAGEIVEEWTDAFLDRREKQLAAHNRLNSGTNNNYYRSVLKEGSYFGADNADVDKMLELADVVNSRFDDWYNEYDSLHDEIIKNRPDGPPSEADYMVPGPPDDEGNPTTVLNKAAFEEAEKEYEEDMDDWRDTYNPRVENFVGSMGNNVSSLSGNPDEHFSNNGVARTTLNTWHRLNTDLNNFRNAWNTEVEAWEDVAEHHNDEIPARFSDAAVDLDDEGIEIDDLEEEEERMTEAQHQFKNALARAARDAIDDEGRNIDHVDYLDFFDTDSPLVPAEDSIIEEDDYPDVDEDETASITDIDEFETIEAFWNALGGWYP